MQNNNPTSPTLPACPEVLNRLKRAEGQLRAVISMIEAGKECDAVVTQLAAAKSALERASMVFVLKLATSDENTAVPHARMQQLAARLA